MESETVTPDGFPVDFYKKVRTTQKIRSKKAASHVFDQGYSHRG